MPPKTALLSLGHVPAFCMQGALSGQTLPLASLWAAAPATPTILVFLRRLGCPMCRVYAQDVDALRKELGAGARVVCLSFERLGEGSDAPPQKGGGFAAGGFFEGELWQVDQAAVYAPLFGRKGLLSGFGLGALVTDKGGKLAQVKERGVTGNMSGDGMQLGGAFVVGGAGPEVLLDKRQAFFGDDASVEALKEAVERGAAAKQG